MAAVGVITKGQGAIAAAATVSAPDLDGRLRAITWTGPNSAVGLVGVGADAVKVRPMMLQGKELRVSGNDIATLEVGAGPLAIGPVPASKDSLLVIRTTLVSGGQYTVSFDLDSNVRQFLLGKGFRFDGHKTKGESTCDIKQAIPEPITIGSSGEAEISTWKDALTKEHYEPISVHNMNGKLFVFLVGSGSNKLEAYLLGNIIALELSSSDASILAVHPIGKLDGHSRRGLEVVELSKSRVAFISENGAETIDVIGYDVFSKEKKHTQFASKELPLSKRILHHDRLTAGGRLNSWIVEVMPGIYSIENTRREVLWPA